MQVHTVVVWTSVTVPVLYVPGTVSVQPATPDGPSYAICAVMDFYAITVCVCALSLV